MWTHKTDALMAVPQVKEWLETLSEDSSRAVYLQHLYGYWTNYLAQKYPDIMSWVESLRRNLKSEENNIRNHWALELKHYLNNYVSKRTGRRLGSVDQRIKTAAIQSFLRYFFGDVIHYKFEIKPTVIELENAQRKAMSFAEVQALYKAARTPRDRALILVMANGVAPKELIQFSNNWQKWWKQDMKAPFLVPLVRVKKRFPYHINLWDDAIDALKELYNERIKEEGDLGGKPLFDQDKKPLSENNLEEIMATLRERAGLKETGVKHQSQRVRAHGFRHFFTTQARLLGVDPGVANFLIGHKPEKGDKYNYDRSHLEDQWVEIVQRESRKLTPVLNILTGRAQEILKDKEAELIAKAGKDTYKKLLEMNMLKVEQLTPDVMRVLAKTVGVTFEKWVSLADTLDLPKERQEQLALFDMISRAVDLSTETYEKYMEALRVMKPTNAKAAWENTENYWMRVEVGTDEYMQALADHFVVEDKEDKMRILRKPKN